jgi:hypothetical protein
MHSLPRKHFLIAVLTGVLLGSVLLLTKVAHTQSQANKKSQEPDPTTTAVRNGGLREAAKLKRVYVSSERTSGWAKYDLEGLTSASSAIIIGTPLSSSSRLSASGDRVITEHEIKIERVVKGNLKPSESISLVVPGGKVTFEDGSSAEIRTLDLGPIAEQKRYVFFLRSSEDKVDAFSLIGGGQGAFELPAPDANVRPLGARTDIVQKHKNQKVSAFVEEVEKAAKEHPETSTCCQ